MTNTPVKTVATSYTDYDLGLFIQRGAMSVSEAYSYAWHRDNTGRAAERAAINSNYVPPTE